MIGFVIWLSFCLSLLNTKQWPNNKTNHSCVYDQIKVLIAFSCYMSTLCHHILNFLALAWYETFWSIIAASDWPCTFLHLRCFVLLCARETMLQQQQESNNKSNQQINKIISEYQATVEDHKKTMLRYVCVCVYRCVFVSLYVSACLSVCTCVYLYHISLNVHDFHDS